MAGYICHVVPPYILQGLIDAPEQHEHVREMAISTLAMTRQCHHERHRASCTSYPQDSDAGHSSSPSAIQGIVPDYILQHIVEAEDVNDTDRSSAQHTLAASGQVRRSRAAGAAIHDEGVQSSVLAGAVPVPPKQPAFNQEIFDMQHNGLWGQLPGPVSLRKEGAAAAKDVAANEVYNNTLLVLKFFWDVFGYTSLDGHNHKVTSSVHFGDELANAWWRVDESLGVKQMVYGDGFGDTLGNFTKALDVIGHEFTVSALPLVAPAGELTET